MSAYQIAYPWVYNPHGSDGPACFDQPVTLNVRYHIQPDEPDVNVGFMVTIEEVMWDNVPLCTDEPYDSGWTTREEERLLEWLLDGEGQNGTPTRLASQEQSA